MVSNEKVRILALSFPETWGRMGATFVDLKKVRLSMLKDAMTVAYATVAPPALGEKFINK